MTGPIFPTILILLMLAAAGEAFWRGDSTRTVYMLAAAILNIVITYPLPRFPWTH